MSGRKFRIWSIEHHAYWKPNRQGYIKDARLAGIYNEADAHEIVYEANAYLAYFQAPSETLIPDYGEWKVSAIK